MQGTRYLVLGAGYWSKVVNQMQKKDKTQWNYNNCLLKNEDSPPLYGVERGPGGEYMMILETWNMEFGIWNM